MDTSKPNIARVYDYWLGGIAEVRRWLSGIAGTPKCRPAYLVCGVGAKP